MSDPIHGIGPQRGKTGARADLLHAYHDGELSGFARWRFERRLRRSPALRRELEALARVGGWVRASHVEAQGPDLWDAIALRLPAADARRAEVASAARRPTRESADAQRAGGERRRAPARAGPRGLGWLAWPGAVAMAVLVAVFALEWLEPGIPRADGVVRWLDSGGRDVMVLEAPDTTIIWVFDAPTKGARRGGGSGKV